MAIFVDRIQQGNYSHFKVRASYMGMQSKTMTDMDLSYFAWGEAKKKHSFLLGSR